MTDIPRPYGLRLDNLYPTATNPPKNFLQLALILLMAGLILPGCRDATYPHQVMVERVTWEGGPDYRVFLHFRDDDDEPAPPPDRAGALMAVAGQHKISPLSPPRPISQASNRITLYAPTHPQSNEARQSFLKAADESLGSIGREEGSVALVSLDPPRRERPGDPSVDGLRPETGIQTSSASPPLRTHLNREERRRLLEAALGDGEEEFRSLVILAHGAASGPPWRALGEEALAAGVWIHVIALIPSGGPSHSPRLQPGMLTLAVNEGDTAGIREAISTIRDTISSRHEARFQVRSRRFNPPSVLDNFGVLSNLPGGGWEISRPVTHTTRPGGWIQLSNLRRDPHKEGRCAGDLSLVSSFHGSIKPEPGQLLLQQGDRSYRFLSHGGTGSVQRGQNYLLIAENPGASPEQTDIVRRGAVSLLRAMRENDRAAFYGTAPSGPGFRSAPTRWAPPPEHVPLVRLQGSNLLQQAAVAATQLTDSLGQDEGGVVVVLSGSRQLAISSSARNRLELLRKIQESGVRLLWLAPDPWASRDEFRDELQQHGGELVSIETPEMVEEASQRALAAVQGTPVVMECPPPTEDGAPMRFRVRAALRSGQVAARTVTLRQ